MTSVDNPQDILDQALQQHYGTPETVLAGAAAAAIPADWLRFPARCAALLAAAAERTGGSTATERSGDGGSCLDVGCGVGGAAFELARTFGSVLGIEMDAAALGTATAAQRSGIVSLRCKVL